MTRNRFIYAALLSILGLWASFTIMVEKIDLLSNPNFKPSCNLNPLLSCGTVMKSHQAATFGFPNPILGLIGFSMLLAFALMGVLGVKFKKTIYVLANLGLTFAAGFSIYLFAQTTYSIGAICLYCVCVWFASLMLFADITIFNFKQVFGLKRLYTFSWVAGLAVFLTMIILIVIRYQYQINLYFFS